MSLWNRGHTYVIHSKRMAAYKIGFSATPNARLEAIRTAVPDGELVYSVDTIAPFERWLHQRLKPFRLDREWFNLPAAELEWISSGAALLEFAPSNDVWRRIAKIQTTTRSSKTIQRNGSGWWGVSKPSTMKSGKTRYWYVAITVGGTRRRRFFQSLSAAEKFYYKALSVGPEILGPKHGEIGEQCGVMDAIKKRGTTLTDVWNFYESHHKEGINPREHPVGR